MGRVLGEMEYKIRRRLKHIEIIDEVYFSRPWSGQDCSAPDDHKAFIKKILEVMEIIMQHCVVPFVKCYIHEHKSGWMTV